MTMGQYLGISFGLYVHREFFVDARLRCFFIKRNKITEFHLILVSENFDAINSF